MARQPDAVRDLSATIAGGERGDTRAQTGVGAISRALVESGLRNGVSHAKQQELRKCLKPADLAPLLTSVEEVIENQTAIIERAVRDGDSEMACNALHMIKGLAGNYGLVELAEETGLLNDRLAARTEVLTDVELTGYKAIAARAIAHTRAFRNSLADADR